MKYLIHLTYPTGDVVTLKFPHASLRGFAVIALSREPSLQIRLEDR